VVIGADDRGTVVGVTDLRSRSSIETANLGVLRVHRRPAKTDLRNQLEALLTTIESWPRGPIGKVLQVAGGEEPDA
jgi:hypothetical protein